jgi:dolichol-phosphate mannosyltransferase
VEAVVRDTRPDRVFHLAAHGAYSWQADAAEMARVNVAGTIALVDACARAGCRALVHAGTSSEYGYVRRAPTEDEAPRPNSAYAVTKLAATLYCAHAAVEGRLPATTLRIYSAYGPWEQPGRLMPTLVAHALRGGLPPLVDPSVARDFVHVDDVVEALVRAAGAGGGAGPILNVGSGHQTTLRELVALVRRVFDVTGEPQWGTAAPRPWDTDVWVADATRARRELDWTPRVLLEGGLRGLGDWLESDAALAERYAGGSA